MQVALGIQLFLCLVDSFGYRLDILIRQGKCIEDLIHGSQCIFTRTLNFVNNISEHPGTIQAKQPRFCVNISTDNTVGFHSFITNSPGSKSGVIKARI